MSATTPIPVTIITGFLGSGKTTLLNQILKKNASTSFLIIENEAGNINIDGNLIQDDKKNSVIELTSGCICCSLNTELGSTLNSVILSDVKYDYILVEATGIADPGQIISMFTGDRIQKYFQLDSVACMVDAVSFLHRINEYGEVSSQVAHADLVLVNKSDLVTEERLLQVQQRISSLNPFAKIENTTFSQVKNNQLLHAGLFRPEKLEKSIFDFSGMRIDMSLNEHVHNIQTMAFNLKGNFDMTRMSSWFEDYLFMNLNRILRIKGLLSIEGMQHKMIIQSVGNDYHLSQGSIWEEGQERVSKIVFIGSDLNEGQIKEDLINLLTQVTVS